MIDDRSNESTVSVTMLTASPVSKLLQATHRNGNRTTGNRINVGCRPNRSQGNLIVKFLKSAVFFLQRSDGGGVGTDEDGSDAFLFSKRCALYAEK